MIIIELILISVSLTIFINYCIGKPGSEFSPYEIFSWYTVLLSVRRLDSVGLYDKYIEQYNDSLSRLKTKHEIVALNNDFRKMLYNAADQFFTWERAVGMCQICTCFWISLIVSILAHQNIIQVGEIVLFSHIIIRFVSKWI